MVYICIPEIYPADCVPSQQENLWYKTNTARSAQTQQQSNSSSATAGVAQTVLFLAVRDAVKVAWSDAGRFHTVQHLPTSTKNGHCTKGLTSRASRFRFFARQHTSVDGTSGLKTYPLRAAWYSCYACSTRGQKTNRQPDRKTPVKRLYVT